MAAVPLQPRPSIDFGIGRGRTRAVQARAHSMLPLPSHALTPCAWQVCDTSRPGRVGCCTAAAPTACGPHTATTSSSNACTPLCCSQGGSRSLGGAACWTAVETVQGSPRAASARVRVLACSHAPAAASAARDASLGMQAACFGLVHAPCPPDAPEQVAHSGASAGAVSQVINTPWLHTY